MMKNDLTVFEDHQIRRIYDEKSETLAFFCSGYYSNTDTTT